MPGEEDRRRLEEIDAELAALDQRRARLDRRSPEQIDQELAAIDQRLNALRASAPHRQKRFHGGLRELIAGDLAPDRPRSLRETAADVVRSGRAGLQRGLAFTAGMRGDLMELGPTLYTAAAQAINPEAKGFYEQRDENFNAVLGEDIGGRVTGALDAGRRVLAPTSQEIIDLVPDETGIRYEPETVPGAYARTIGEFAPGGALPGSATQRIARAVIPGAASEAAGQATEGSEAEPFARAAAGLGGGFAAEGASSIGQVVSRFGQTPSQRAVRMIDRGLRDSATTLPEVQKRSRSLSRQGGPTEETIAEAGGAALQRQARAVANVRGPGTQIAQDTLEARTQSITPRVLREATRATGPRQTRSPTNYYDAREALREARSGQARQNYRVAYSQPVDQAAYVNEIAPLMVGGPVQQTAAKQAASIAQAEVLRIQSQLSLARQLPPDLIQAQSALRQATQALKRNSRSKPLLEAATRAREEVARIQGLIDDGQPLLRDLQETQEAVRHLEGLAQGNAPSAANPRVIDYFQRGLRQLAESEPPRSQLGTAYNTAREAFLSAADRAAPALGEARQLWGQSNRIEELMADGRRIFTMPEGEIDLLLRGPRGRGLSMEEMDGFMLGALDAIEQKVRGGDTAFVARFMRNENWQRQLERALGKNGARRLRNRIAREASMRRFDNSVRAPSQTTPMREDIRGLTEGEDELSFLAEMVQSGGNIKSPIVRRLAGAYDRFRQPGIYNPRVNEELARRLYQTATPANLSALEAEMAAIKRDPTSPDMLPAIGVVSASSAFNREQERKRRVGAK